MEYDPLKLPDPEAWLAFDEGKLIELAMDYHRRMDEVLPNTRVHATIHVIVENQLAMTEEIPVQQTLNRLMGEGLDRHDAIHAIGSVLMLHLHDMMTGKIKGPDPNEPYHDELKRLTAEKWLRSDP